MTCGGRIFLPWLILAPVTVETFTKGPVDRRAQPPRPTGPLYPGPFLPLPKESLTVWLLRTPARGRTGLPAEVADRGVIEQVIPPPFGERPQVKPRPLARGGGHVGQGAFELRQRVQL